MPTPLTASFVLLLVSLYTDLLWRKIPNVLTLAALSLAFFHYINLFGPTDGSLLVLKGMFTGIIFLIVPFMLGGSGGGDVKLFGALGALIGGAAVSSVFIYTAMAGGVFSLFYLVKRGEFRLMKTVFHDTAFLLLSAGRRERSCTNDRIPYSLPAMIGFLAYMTFGGFF